MLLGSPVFTGRSGGGALGQLLGEGADCDVACGSQGGLTVLPLSPRPVGKSLWPAFSIETGLPGRQDVTNRSGFSVAQAWQRHSREAVQPVQEAAQLPPRLDTGGCEEQWTCHSEHADTALSGQP